MFRSYDHHQVGNILLSRTTQLTNVDSASLEPLCAGVYTVRYQESKVSNRLVREATANIIRDSLYLPDANQAPPDCRRVSYRFVFQRCQV
jgi:hypothetical protein